MSIQNESLLEFNASDIKLPDELKTWDDFLIGQGGFANVYEVRIYVTDENNSQVEKKAALKKFKYDRFATDKEAKEVELTKLKHEASIVNQISHEHIIRLFGVCYDEHFFGILIELCEGGSLGNVCRSIKKESTLSLRVLANWAHQISSAMKYLTDRKLLHRDLKADNVLVKEQVCFCSESEQTALDWCEFCEKRPLNKLQLKLTDFGLSKTTMSVGDSIVGTLVWLAPEVFQRQDGQSAWSEFSDVWSFGVVLWELLAREMPHAGVYPIVVAHWNQEGQTLQLKESWPLKWKEIMKQCWSLNPKLRPSFESLVQYFEEYTKGLVEVHISDLPGRKKKKKSLKLNCFPVRSVRGKLPKNQILIISAISFLSMLALSSLAFYALKPKSSSICSEGYVFFNTTGFCYKTSVHPTTQKLAAANCADDGAFLTSIHSKLEDEFVLKLYNDQLKEYRLEVNPLVDRSQVWIGYEYDRWRCEWVWSDGVVSRYFNWDGNEQLANRYFWTIMHPEKNGKWSVADDKREAAFICKKPNITGEAKLLEWKKEHPEVIKECASGYTWLKETGFCYKIEFDAFTFNEATHKCAAENANLISIHNSEQHSAIVKLYKTQLAELFYNDPKVTRSYIWLGLTYANETWNWSDGTEYDFQNWAPQTPRDEELEYYWSVLAIESDKPGWTLSDYWRDVGSNNFFAFICQKNDSSMGETTVMTSVVPNVTMKHKEEVDRSLRNCSTGYEYFELTGYCYRSGTESLTYSEAKRECKKEEALVASVHSKEESDFIIDLANKALRPERIYISLHYNTSQWMNADGSEADYWNWMQGEPNFIFPDPRNSETRVAIILGDVDERNLSHDKWSNLTGKFRYGYVCKKKAI